MAEGEFALVRQHLEAALLQTVEWVGDHDLYAMLADVAVRQGDLPGLQHYAPLAEESATRYNHPLYLAVAQRAFGVAHRLVGEYDRAQARLKEALDSFTQIGAHWQIGRTHFELGELARARGDAATAIGQLRIARDEFDKQGAVPDRNQARAALAELGGL
ncbi:MAG: hypothetical protein ACRDHG_04385 [Anaerolineales bacterium]